MQSTFSRALMGFVVLTVAIISMALVALWTIETFSEGLWWASILVVLIALVVEIGIYSSTLHDPIYDWIREPKLLAAAEERERAEAKRKAERAEATPKPPVIHEDQVG